MTMTMAPAGASPGSLPCCPKCGFDLALGLPPLDGTQAALLEAQKQIEDLQAQVRLLNQKAAAAVDRWADYEDELARLRAAVGTTANQQPQQQQQRSAATRISALLSPRKSTPNLRSPPPSRAIPPLPPKTPPPSTSSTDLPPTSPSTPQTTDDLLAALSREQRLRAAAEGRLSDTSREVEELSVSLFEQANEMVAAERRARARLEERVEVLERRDAEKRRRLERLEMAVGRIERVRALLGEGGGAGGQ